MATGVAEGCEKREQEKGRNENQDKGKCGELDFGAQEARKSVVRRAHCDSPLIYLV